MAGNFVVAGGSTGIGLSLVKRLSKYADQILVLSRNVGKLEISSKVKHLSIDFQKEDFGEIDLPEVINGAAYCPGTINLRSFQNLKPKDFGNDFEINVIGAVKFLHMCLPGLKKAASGQPASVVMFSTVATSLGLPLHASISASKGAVEGLARSLAAELAPEIRVNCIAPALTETPLTSRFFRTETSRNSLAAKYPLERTGLPDDISSMAEFLLGNSAEWITGQVFGVDGGMSTLAGK